MKVIVFGASGATGRELVAQALARGLEVTAFVRTPAKLGLSHDNLALTQGDVADASSIERAMAGQEAVLSALGVGKPLRHDQVVVDGIGHLVRAMQGAGVRRVVYLSTVAVPDSRRHAGLVIRLMAAGPIRHEVGDHAMKEAVVRSSGLDWTIVRAPLLTNGRRTGVYRCGEDVAARSPLPMLSRADVAEFMLRQLTDAAFVRKAPRLMP